MSVDPPSREPPRVDEEGALFDGRIQRTLARLTNFDRWMIVIGLSLATGLELGVQVATNVILPDMRGNVAASQDEISWVITVYAAAFIAVLPLTNWFARRIGPRDFLVSSLLIYAAGAVGCFLSTTLSSLLAARVVMGVGGGAFLVRSLTALFRLYRPRERIHVLLVFGLVLSSSRALMPVLFGVVTDAQKWNVAYLAVVPLSLLAAALLYCFVPRHLDFAPDPPPADLVAAGLIVIGLAAFQVAMSRGEQDMWLQSPLIRSALVASALCLALFVWWDTRASNNNPILNLRLLCREPGLASGLVMAVLLGALLAASLFILPQYLRGIEGYSATQTSFFFCADAAATYFGIVFGAEFAPRISARAVVLLGLCLFALANHLFVMQLAPDTPPLNLFLILLLHGGALGMMLPAVTNLLLGRASPRYISFDMMIYYLVRGLGGVAGVGAAIAMFDIRETVHSSRLLDVANRLNPATHLFVTRLGHVLYAKGMAPNVASTGSYGLFQRTVMGQSALLAFVDLFWCFEMLALGGVILVLLTWRLGKRPAAPPTVSSPAAALSPSRH